MGTVRLRLLLNWLTMSLTIRSEILKTSHGRRSIDVLGILAPSLATWDCKISNNNDIGTC